MRECQIICDRCMCRKGDHEERQFMNIYVGQAGIHDDHGTDAVSGELCMNCVEELKQWMKPKKAT